MRFAAQSTVTPLPMPTRPCLPQPSHVWRLHAQFDYPLDKVLALDKTTMTEVITALVDGNGAEGAKRLLLEKKRQREAAKQVNHAKRPRDF
jgi:hypothetical protein